MLSKNSTVEGAGSAAGEAPVATQTNTTATNREHLATNARIICEASSRNGNQSLRSEQGADRCIISQSSHELKTQVSWGRVVGLLLAPLL
jgi:hypothetical protein